MSDNKSTTTDSEPRIPPARKRARRCPWAPNGQRPDYDPFHPTFTFDAEEDFSDVYDPVDMQAALRRLQLPVKKEPVQTSH